MMSVRPSVYRTGPDWTPVSPSLTVERPYDDGMDTGEKQVQLRKKC